MLTAALAVVLVTSLPGLAAAIAMPQPTPGAAPETAHRAQHRAHIPLWRHAMEFLITVFFWVGWAVLVGVPLALTAWAISDHIRHRDDLTQPGGFGRSSDA